VRMTYFTAKTTEPVNNLTIPVGTTAASGATTIVFGQYSIDVSGNLTLLAATTNDTMLLAGGSGAESTKALSATINEIAGVRYARALFFVGATAPTVYGAVLPSPETARTPRLAGLLQANRAPRCRAPTLWAASRQAAHDLHGRHVAMVHYLRSASDDQPKGHRTAVPSGKIPACF